MSLDESLRVSDSCKDDIQRKGYFLVSKSTHHHQFTINDWSRRQKDNKIINDFTLANSIGDKFSIEIYPNGLDEESMDYISAKLINKSMKDQTGHFRVGLLRNDPEIMVTNIEHEYSVSRTLAAEGQGSVWIIPNFAGKSHLSQTQAYTANNSIIVTADITLIDEPEFVSKVSIPLVCLPTGARANNIETLSDDISKLYNNPLQSDLTLCAEGVGFYCHKVILSIRSPYFNEKFKLWSAQILRRMFNHRVYVVKNIHPRVLGEVLRFIYTDACK